MSDFEKEENGLSDNEQPQAAEESVTQETLNEEASAEETAAEEAPAEDNSEAVTDTAETSPDENLNEELEGIRSKFQEILDETAEAYLAGGDIQEVDNGEEPLTSEEEEISEDELCQCCGEKRRATEFGEDYPYCAECRKLMQHFPISAGGVLSLIFILVLTCVSIFYVFGSNATLIDSAITADSNEKSGKIYSALESYSTALQSYVPDSSALGSKAVPKKVAARYAKTYASLLNYNYAYSVVEQFFSEKDLKNPAYKELADYSVKNDCYSLIMETINTALQDEKNGADEINKLLEALKQDEKNDAFLIDYYEYIVIQYFGEKAEKQYEILTELEKNYPDKWPVKYELCAICSKLGKADEAQKYLEEVIKHNSEDGAIYAYLADAYRFSETPDADKMLEVLEKGFAADGDSGYSVTDLNRVKAVAFLLKGDYDSAYDAASAAYQTAYSSLSYGYSINNLSQCLYTYQLCAHLKEDKDAYDSVTAILGYVGLDESKDIKKFVKGKQSLENILTNKEGDLA